MSLVTPTLNLPTAKAVAAPAASTPAPAVPAPAKASDAPSATVTLSPQAQAALQAMNTAGHPSSAAPAPAPVAAPAPHDDSVYESLKHGIASAVTDVGDAIGDGAHAVVEGVEATLSAVNTGVKGLLGLPFAAVAKVCDAAGAIIDKA